MHLKWVNVTLGAVLALAPFVFRFSGTPAALWTCVGMGVVIAVLGYIDQPKWLAAAGAVTFLAPFILRFSAIEPAMVTCISIGAVIAVANVFEGYLLDETKAAPKQPQS